MYDNQDHTDMICVDPLPVASFNYNPQQVVSIDPTTNSKTLPHSTTRISGILTMEQVLRREPDTPIPNRTNRKLPGRANRYFRPRLQGYDYSYCNRQRQLLFYVPNAFTPDGDQFNNVFFPVMTAGFSPATYEFYIYNRWGELIFESRDTQVGWDGTYAGSMVQAGIYTWVIRFKDDDNDEKFEYSGHVNLIK